MRRLLILITFLVMFPISAYNLTVVSKLDTSCGSGWEEVAGLSRTTNAHVADPSGVYTTKLCISGELITGGGFTNSALENDESELFGVDKNSNSHSEDPAETSYTYLPHVSCPVNSTLRIGSCDAEETCIIELYKTTNSHVAECGTGATYTLCVKSVEPDTFEYACTCGFSGAEWGESWGATKFQSGTTTYCCGDDSGEVTGTPIDSATCALLSSEDVCSTGNNCGNYSDWNGQYQFEPPGTSCSSYLCSEGDWQICDSGNPCGEVDLNNDGYYDQFCDSSLEEWRLTSLSTDMCETACDQLNGIWTEQGGGEDPKNCCSSQDTGQWCVVGATRVTKCDEGRPTDCGVECDTTAVINDDGNQYTCTSSTDRDCASDSCSGDDCACTKGLTTGCYIGSACISSNCETFNVAAGETSYFSEPSDPNDAENPGSFSGICCESNECAYDSVNDSVIDSCAADATATLDSDIDGDTDYCNAGSWDECANYWCLNATDCSCLGNTTHQGFCNYWNETAGVYSADEVGLCNLVNVSEACATPCDTDGNTATREYINNGGFCVKGGGSCLDIYQDYSWYGNSSLSFVNVSVDCLCEAQASCTVSVYDADDNQLYTTGAQSITADGTPQYIDLSDPFDLGTNIINMTCNCGAGGPPSSCRETVTTLDYQSSSSVDVDRFKVGNTYVTGIYVSNIGDVDLASYVVGMTITSGGVSLTNISDAAYLTAGASTLVNISLNIPIDIFNDTKQTLSNETSIIVFTNVSDVILMHDFEDLCVVYQCDAAADCPTACPSPAGNCWQNGSLAGDFSCSYGVCCPNSHHFESGGCCPTGYTCCITDGACTLSEWCANASTYSDYGIVWSCNDLRFNGQTCEENRMCDSANCESAGVGGSIYCCQSIVTISEAGGECSTLSGGEVCESSGCCTSNTECNTGLWCTPYGNRCVNCPGSDDAGYMNGYCTHENCTGYDADCCRVDADCNTIQGIAGSDYYCNTETANCDSCTTRQDYYCPSARCYEAGPSAGDPDCCSTDTDCIEGTECLGSNCVPKNIGMYCTADAECGSGLSCLDDHCVLNEFLYVSPTSVDMNVGEIRYATIIVRDPRMRADEKNNYTLSLSGDNLQFASIETGEVTTESLEIQLSGGEVKKFTIVLYGGRSVESSTLKVTASNSIVGGLSAEKQISLTVTYTAGSGLMAAAPGIDLKEAFAVLIIGGVLVWSLKKL